MKIKSELFEASLLGVENDGRRTLKYLGERSLSVENDL